MTTLTRLFACAALMVPAFPMSSAATTQTESSPIADVMSALQAQFQRPAQPQNQIDAAAQAMRDWSNLKDQLNSLQSYLDREDFNNALSQARRYEAQAASPEVKAAWTQMIEAIRKEALKRDSDYISSFNESVKQIRTLLLNAKTREDVEPAIAIIEALQADRNGNYNARIQLYRNRAGEILNVCTAWQDFLDTLNSNQTEDARQALKSLMSNYSTGRARVLTRSDFQQRLDKLPLPKDALEVILTNVPLDELPAKLDQIKAAQEEARGRSSNDLLVALGEIENLITATELLKADKIADAMRTLLKPVRSSSCSTSLNTGGVGVMTGELGRLKSEWFHRAMPALVGSKKIPSFKKNESVLDYARRQLAAAIDDADWATALRYAKIERAVAPESSTCGLRGTQFGADTVAALDAWLKGQKMENAGQIGMAAHYWRKSLAAGAPEKLEALVIEKLVSTSKQHPEIALAAD